MNEKNRNDTTTDFSSGVSWPPGKSPQRRRGVRATIYILPNLITATSFFCGFLAITFATTGTPSLERFAMAAYAILLAGIADGLDGSVARWTRTQSAFGVQFDSLSDLVSFGVAPAILAYQFALKDLGRMGFAAAFIFALCGALRLARFNVQTSVGKGSGNFTGIPIPMGAAPIAIFVLLHKELNGWITDNSEPLWKITVANFLTDTTVRNLSFFAVTMLLGLGMISTFEYISTKTLRLPKRHPFRVFTGILVAIVLLLSVDFILTLSAFMFIYYLHGPVMWLFFKRDRSDEEAELFTSADEDEEEDSAP